MYSFMRERRVEGLLGKRGLRRYWIPFYKEVKARDVWSLASLCELYWVIL